MASETRPDSEDQSTWNPNRDRWYGIRVGDAVEWRAMGLAISGDVVELDPMDNNRVYIETDDRRPRKMKVTPEHCVIVRRVEDV